MWVWYLALGSFLYIGCKMLTRINMINDHIKCTRFLWEIWSKMIYCFYCRTSRQIYIFFLENKSFEALFLRIWITWFILTSNKYFFIHIIIFMKCRYISSKRNYHFINFQTIYDNSFQKNINFCSLRGHGGNGKQTWEIKICCKEKECVYIEPWLSVFRKKSQSRFPLSYLQAKVLDDIYL